MLLTPSSIEWYIPKLTRTSNGYPDEAFSAASALTNLLR